MTMREGDYGFTIRIDTDFDLSTATSLDLNVKLPDASSSTKTMTLGTTDANVAGVGLFAANEYAEYVTQSGDFAQSGTYFISLTATYASQKFKTPDGKFVIGT